MIVDSAALWIVATGALAGISCSMVGSFLVLRRMAMLGDAVSHSVLLGLVVAFLVSSSRAVGWMFGGAIAIGLLTAALTQVLVTKGHLREDASLGVVFTTLFAIGVILLSLYAGQIDIDQDCVLYGELALVPLDTIMLGGVELGPRAFWMLACATVLVGAVVFVAMRALTLLTFDEVLAKSLGMPTGVWHYVLMALVSVTIVAAFEAVGAVLVVALIVFPPNIALVWAKSMRALLFGSALVSIASSVGGYALAGYVDASIGGAMVVVLGIICAAAFCARGALRRLRLG